MAPKPLLQVAPMADVTLTDFRVFMRLLSRRAQLWTEMVPLMYNTPVDDAFVRKYFQYHEMEHPLVCQLGCNDAECFVRGAQLAERHGFDEVNLNVGCPSSRVGKGDLGCSLMKSPERVRELVHAASRAVQIPVTVKCRLGVDDQDSPEFTRRFVETVAQGGCTHFVVHARKAWLKGLSPAENRTRPPLMYPRVLELCHAFPQLDFSINGGILDAAHARALLGFPGGRRDGETDSLIPKAWDWSSAAAFPGVPANLIGVMAGRAPMDNPMMLWDVDQCLYGDPYPDTPPTRRTLLQRYKEVLGEKYPPGEGGGPEGSYVPGDVSKVLRPLFGLTTGLRGGRAVGKAFGEIQRDKQLMRAGPTAVVDKIMEVVDRNLDLPLERTGVYRPIERPPARAAQPCEPQADAKRRRLQPHLPG